MRTLILLLVAIQAFAADYRVDPFWPKPLPAPKDASGVPHQWISGETGGTCVDANDHVFSINRGWQPGRLGGLLQYEGTNSIPSPPVIEFDGEGNGRGRRRAADSEVQTGVAMSRDAARMSACATLV
jgi:hypothetical protein